MKGIPQLHQARATLDADAHQAVLDLRAALRSQREAKREYDREARSPGRRDTVAHRLARTLDRATATLNEARRTLDTVLLGED